MSKRVAAGAIALITLTAACSSTKHTTAPGATTTTKPPTTTAAGCTPPATGPVQVAAVPNVASDHTLTSFDGARIRLHWFPIANPPAKGAPTVLMGPGWGSGGSTDTQTSGAQGFMTIKDLRDAGYNVLTWDPRGFGVSTGTIEVDSADFEARDVERLLDWVATQPGVQLDGPRDPRVGMVGASYGGGIQLTTAAIDCRVDAIVPSWAWNSLTTSLDKSLTPKTGWGTFLYGAAAGHQLDEHISAAQTSSLATGVIPKTDREWFAQRGPGNLVANIHVPTLFVQGTVDTLFTLDEAVQNYEILRAHDVPTAMIWFCGGHGVCLTNPGDQQQVEQRQLDWLAHYVKRDSAVATGPGFQTVDQNGATYSAPSWPLKDGTAIAASGAGTLNLVTGGGAGPAVVPAGTGGLLGNLVGPITPSKATNAVNVTVPTGATAAVIAGRPVLHLTYHGTATGVRPMRVFAQLVDPTTGLVLGNQITPVSIVLDGKTHSSNAVLEMVAFTTKPAGSLILQIVATTVAYAQPRLGGSVTMTAKLELPRTTLTPTAR
jgi:ABC-2 type transport system ATP-binding protein